MNTWDEEITHFRNDITSAIESGCFAHKEINWARAYSKRIDALDLLHRETIERAEFAEARYTRAETALDKLLAYIDCETCPVDSCMVHVKDYACPDKITRVIAKRKPDSAEGASDAE